MQNILVVLGSENTPYGELGSIAKDRLNKCLNLFSEEYFIQCTGGWGEHFNTTKIGHAHYAIDYLKSKGIPSKVILPPLLSSHTVDDALKIKEYYLKKKNVKLFILTSDFHLERVKLIFKEILNEFELTFIEAESTLSESDFNRKVVHENKSVQAIISNGLYY